MTTKVTKLDDRRAEAARELSCLEPSLSGSLENRSIRDITAQFRKIVLIEVL